MREFSRGGGEGEDGTLDTKGGEGEIKCQVYLSRSLGYAMGI